MTPSDPRTPDALASPDEAVAPRTISPRELFFAFSSLALSGFGGVLPFAYRALVERRKWIDARDFASLLAIAQVMPGPTICNLSVMIGQRYAGFAGSCAALGGMVAGPSCIVIALGIAWQHYGGLAAVKHALGGMSAVAIGLIAATAAKMAINLFKRGTSDGEGTQRYWSLRRLAHVALCALAFIGVGVMRWPLVAVVLGLGPLAVALAWFTD
jgi:chromate transporter